MENFAVFILSQQTIKILRDIKNMHAHYAHVEKHLLELIREGTTFSTNRILYASVMTLYLFTIIMWEGRI